MSSTGVKCLAYGCRNDLSVLDLTANGRFCFYCTRKEYFIIRVQNLIFRDKFKVLLSDNWRTVTVRTDKNINSVCSTRFDNGDRVTNVVTLGADSKQLVYYLNDFYKKSEECLDLQL